MRKKGKNWQSAIPVLIFLGISVGAIAGARASDILVLNLVGVLAALVSAVSFLVIKIEKPARFAVIPQVLLILFIISGAATILLVQWGPRMGLVAGAAYGAIFSLLLGWNYADSLRQNPDNSK